MPEIVTAIQVARQGVPYVEYGITHGYETCFYCWLFGKSIQATYELVWDDTTARTPLCHAHATQAEKEIRNV